MLEGVSLSADLSALCPRTTPNPGVRQITGHHEGVQESASYQHRRKLHRTSRHDNTTGSSPPSDTYVSPTGHRLDSDSSIGVVVREAHAQFVVQLRLVSRVGVRRPARDDVPQVADQCLQLLRCERAAGDGRPHRTRLGAHHRRLERALRDPRCRRELGERHVTLRSNPPQPRPHLGQHLADLRRPAHERSQLRVPRNSNECCHGSAEGAVLATEVDTMKATWWWSAAAPPA